MSLIPSLVWMLVLIAGTVGAVERGPIQSLWLPIVSTESSLEQAVSRATTLGGHLRDDLQLIATMDCQNLRKGLFLVTAGAFDTRSSAEAAVEKLRSRGVRDAYLRRCEVVAPSRLSMQVPLLDTSLIQKQVEAVNWTLDDAISRVVELNERVIALVLPRYETDLDDIREGLRIGVKVSLTEEQRLLKLSSDCIDPHFAFDSAHIALVCVAETAADHLLHRTTIYSLADGEMIGEAERCTEPQFEQGRWICQRESVDANGQRTLTPIELIEIKSGD